MKLISKLASLGAVMVLASGAAVGIAESAQASSPALVTAICEHSGV